MELHYYVRDPWEWVVKEALKEMDDVVEATKVASSDDLPSASTIASFQAEAISSPSPRRRRRQRNAKKTTLPSTLRMDALKHQKVFASIHGVSKALDGLEDKDELVRTFQRCRADHYEMTPPSVLLRWDLTRDECKNIVRELPKLMGETASRFAVLKEPMGSRGEGIYFVQSVDEIYKIIEEQRENDGEFLDDVIEAKGRIPAWVLQAEIYPPMLINGGRKFHIRSYVVVLEEVQDNDRDHSIPVTYLFGRHEVRVAATAVDTTSDDRDRRAHVTNAVFSTKGGTERMLLREVEELVDYYDGLEQFISKLLHHLRPDLNRRIQYAAREFPSSLEKFALAGLDIMMTEDGRFYLLEVNVNPSVPPKDRLTPSFQRHVVGFFKDLLDLVMRKPDRSDNFLRTEEILETGRI